MAVDSKPDLVLRRAANGFIITPLTDNNGALASVATTVDDLLEHVRHWAEPPKAARPSRKH
jgi:hypothetical protein